MRRRRGVAALVLAGLASGCAGLTGPAGSQQTSTAAEPPAGWESAVLFQFRDSVTDPHAGFAARVEFQTEHSVHAVTGRDVFVTQSNIVRTPWYRLGLPRGASQKNVMLRVVLQHSAGGRTVAEYPLVVKPDEFYYVTFGVATRRPDPPHNPGHVRGLRSYPVPVDAQGSPGDSLWIGYHSTGRYCFECPG